MKKILVKEESCYICDLHPEKECQSEVSIIAWYDSDFDLTDIKINLCDNCLKKLLDFIKNEFKIKI